MVRALYVSRGSVLDHKGKGDRQVAPTHQLRDKECLDPHALYVTPTTCNLNPMVLAQKRNRLIKE
jgi:hypothetical protein